ncbi:glyoxalase [Pseudoalteromonas citrea]|uniref:Glyoxalase n=1 Tax=Pseudoalteromonas citrea TaxID=43655 RepID=A0A5S3XNG4_9GAMM|nr:VOC family protein [Pseudoalteromonas citrea]TMP43893.1 glyoxalase [Pseudoalteromonas citrea]TMP58548.1 glyoxalase [Pseudoalteromonas citrea]
MKNILNHTTRIDHLAIAVRELQPAIEFYCGILGFELLREREVTGQFSGMLAAELCGNGFTIVLVQGTNEESQVSRFVREYGPGVQHVAIEVENLDEAMGRLHESGLAFSTNVIHGDQLKQIFTMRDQNSGTMFEFIEKQESTSQFEKTSIQNLFEQLEVAGAY